MTARDDVRLGPVDPDRPGPATPVASQTPGDQRKGVLRYGLAFGGGCSLGIAVLHRGVGAVSAAVTVAVFVAWGPAWPLVRRRARRLVLARIAGGALLGGMFLLLGVAATADAIALPPALFAGLLAGSVAGGRLRADVARRAARWDAQTAVIERDVVDLRAATYNPAVPVDLGPVVVGSPGASGTVVGDPTDAASVARRAAPIVGVAAALAAVLAGAAFDGGLKLVLGVLALVSSVWWSAPLAPLLLTYQRLTAYERQIGRPIRVVA